MYETDADILSVDRSAYRWDDVNNFVIPYVK